jgi:hypothetical protein
MKVTTYGGYFYFWTLHHVACIIRIVGNTVPPTISIVVCFIMSYCRYMFRSLFDHLKAEHTIWVFGSYTNNVSDVLDSIFIIVYYGLFLYGKILPFNILTTTHIFTYLSRNIHHTSLTKLRTASKNYCQPKPRCVKCPSKLLTNQCHRKERSSDVRCVLCCGNHPANYKGCTVYKKLQKKTYPPLHFKNAFLPHKSNILYTLNHE